MLSSARESTMALQSSATAMTNLLQHPTGREFLKGEMLKRLRSATSAFESAPSLYAIAETK